ncbi:Ubiquitin [Cynara cardunculus var. scolymus]|uniref:Ubiquitin n=1 Tax=Cynara cardunculus var. scolymus TaxID=59895 RepID=A0A103XDM4_CYNCS|nr:Ubiquitin [Cynara cardunculus var. scolymus]
MRTLEEDSCNHDDIDNTDNYSFEINESSSTLSILSSPLLLIETLSRKSFSYGKLPLEPIKLTVLKLDGSSFDITVAKNPTVAQLKQAVEAAFSHLPKHGIGKFCLCFEGQKLLQDQNPVGLHWIKDGDQLQFVRHTSICYNLVKERPEKRDYELEESKASPSKPEEYKDADVQDEENEKEDIAVNITCECSWGQLLRRLFSYRRQKGRDSSYKELGSSKSTGIST